MGMNTLHRSLVLIVLLLASYSLAVKPSCKVCKDFVQAFNKVSVNIFDCFYMYVCASV